MIHDQIATPRRDARALSQMMRAMPAAVPAGAIMAASLLLLLWRSGSAISAGAALLLVLAAMLVSLGGEALLGLASRADFPGRTMVALILGVVTAALVQLAGVFLLRLDAGMAFLLFAVPAAFAVLRRPFPSTASAAPDLAALVAIALIVAFACRDLVTVLPTLLGTGHMAGFVDDLLHAAHVADFGDPRALGRGYLLLPDMPLFLYHYAYYMPTAALARLFDLSPLVAATAILMPVGLLLTGAGAYALAASLGGRMAGLLAVAALAALPDAGRYGVANSFFGFHWVIFSTPGSGYGVAAAAAALVCFHRVSAGESRRLAIVGAFLAAAMFQLRAHLFLLFVPTLLLWWAAGLTPLRRHPRPSAAVIAAAIMLAIVAFLVVPAVSQAVLARSNVDNFLAIAHDYLGPSLRPGWFAQMSERLGLPVATLLGVALVFPAVLGVFVLLYPAALALVARRFGLRHIDALPPILAGCYAGLMLFAPSARFAEPYTELQHRPLVLVYVVVAAFTAAYLARLAGLERIGGAAALAGAGGLAVASIGLAAVTGYDAPRPGPSLVATYYQRAMPEGLVPLALALRENARPGDTFAVAVPERDYDVVDLGTEIAAISGVPSYVARVKEQSTVSEAYAREIERRLALLAAVAGSRDPHEAFAMLRAAGIDWYVVPVKAPPAFAAGLAGAVASTPAGMLYRVPGEASPRPSS